MKKETSKQMTLKIQEVNKMSVQNIPYSNKSLLKWSAFCVERSEDTQRPYNLIKKTLVDLVKVSGYEKFRDRLNWLYNNYSAQNYELVWSELQAHNAKRIQKCFQDNAIEIADKRMQKQVENIIAHFGEIPQWIENLHKGFEIHFNCGLKSDTNPYYDTGLYFEDATLDTKQAFSKVKAFVKSKGVNLPDRKIWRRTKIVDVRQQTKAKRELLLDRARTCYGLHPEYELCTVETKQLYSVSERYIKDYNEFGDPIYYSNEELYKAHIVPQSWQTLVGRVQVTVESLKRLAEDAVIRDAKWMAQFNDTDCDLRACRETEGDENHNVMVPVADLQGPDSPYGLDIEFRDFLEPIYENDSDDLSAEDSILDTIIANETADGEGL